jgi:hypothetical protein
MGRTCLDMAQLAAVDWLPADDPRRRHLADCARCRARLAAYRAFESPPGLPEGADLPDAEARLGAFLQQEIGVGEEPARPRRRDWRRPLLALAAVLVVAVGLTLVTDDGEGPPRTPILRGDEEAVRQGGVRAGALAAASEVDADGRVVLSWSAVGDADTYRVVLYGADLSELDSFDAGPATSLTLDPADLPAAEAGLVWTVIALRAGDEVLRSPARVLALP